MERASRALLAMLAVSCKRPLTQSMAGRVRLIATVVGRDRHLVEPGGCIVRSIGQCGSQL